MNKMIKKAAGLNKTTKQNRQRSLLSNLNNNEIARLKQKWMMTPMEHDASLDGLREQKALLGHRTHRFGSLTHSFRTGNRRRLVGYGRPRAGGGGGGYPPLIPTTKNSQSIWSRAQFQDQLSRFPTLAKWCPKTILPNGTHVWQYPNHAPSVLCISN